jgi:acetoin utilization protein AcuC
MTKLHIAYGDDYLDWRLGTNHPTNPERALLATDLLINELGEDNIEIVLPEVDESDVEKLYSIHLPEYVDEVVYGGISNDWVGENKVLGVTALKMFAGTARLVEKMIAGEVKVAFNPQGAKHHAHYDYSHGFCVFNDLAWAGKEFAKAGLKAMYVDWDAHHGDGVEELLYDTPILTASIHDGTGYPGTGRDGHDEKSSVYNWALPAYSGDVEFCQAMDEIAKIADEYQPDVILLATGADGHKTDPLASLQFDYDGYNYASNVIARIANKYANGRVLIGGAGGYQPHTHTPAIWTEVVSTIYRSVTNPRLGVSDLTTTAK